VKNPPPNKEDLFKLEASLRRNTVRINVAMRRRTSGRFEQLARDSPDPSLTTQLGAGASVLICINNEHSSG
jgi:hypothetical protein